MSIASSPWSTLIIRAWVNDEGGLRARLTEVDDADKPGRSVAVTEGADGALGAIREWLVRVQSGPPD